MLRVVIGTLLLAGLASGGLAVATKGNAKASQPGKLGVIDRSHAGEAAPPISIEAKGGKTTTVAAFVAAAHKPVLVNLWATWCVRAAPKCPRSTHWRRRRGRS